MLARQAQQLAYGLGLVQTAQACLAAELQEEGLDLVGLLRVESDRKGDRVGRARRGGALLLVVLAVVALRGRAQQGVAQAPGGGGEGGGSEASCRSSSRR
ncbi:hypothetical protein ACFT8P_35195 [Streptomyces sp. NPDC057101]|uniref:hypothetical protein n=1 Tax=Streptomyces sp. NPDC057101 TaxID=3346020 RepID=UPI00362D89F0